MGDLTNKKGNAASSALLLTSSNISEEEVSNFEGVKLKFITNVEYAQQEANGSEISPPLNVVDQALTQPSAPADTRVAVSLVFTLFSNTIIHSTELFTGIIHDASAVTVWKKLYNTGVISFHLLVHWQLFPLKYTTQ